MNESTLVPREEMSDLDWLARNVHVWPFNIFDAKPTERYAWNQSREGGDIIVIFRDNPSVFTKDQWLARRADLQNKPSWKDAPEWANWLGQSNHGDWWWHESEPLHGDVTYRSSAGKFMSQCAGEVLGDWRDTLEKRPEIDPEISYNLNFESFMPFVSVEDAATAKQQAPKGSGNPILGMVLADLTNRALEGKEKYGEPLLAHNGRNPLWDAYQEALDLAMYLRQAIEEQK